MIGLIQLAIAIGPILQGLKKPVNDLSRGVTVDNIINTQAITAIKLKNLTGRQPPESISDNRINLESNSTTPRN